MLAWAQISAQLQMGVHHWPSGRPAEYCEILKHDALSDSKFGKLELLSTRVLFYSSSAKLAVGQMSLAEQYPVGSVVWYECDPRRFPWWPCEVRLKQPSLKLLTSLHARLAPHC